jgi:hypothetical protein
MTAVRCVLAGAAFLLMTTLAGSAPRPVTARPATTRPVVTTAGAGARCHVRIIRTPRPGGGFITRRVWVCR